MEKSIETLTQEAEDYLEAMKVFSVTLLGHPLEKLPFSVIKAYALREAAKQFIQDIECK